MAVVPKCTRPQSAFLAQITEKPGRRIGERDPRGRSADVAGEAMNNQAQELFNRTANLFCEPLTGLAAAPAWAVCPNPPGNKVLRIRRQLLKSLRSLCAGELAKLDQQWKCQRRTKLSLFRRCRCPSFNELFISRARHDPLVAPGSYAVPPPDDLAESRAGAAVFSGACVVSPARRFSLSLKLSPLILMVLE